MPGKSKRLEPGAAAAAAGCAGSGRRGGPACCAAGRFCTRRRRAPPRQKLETLRRLPILPNLAPGRFTCAWASKSTQNALRAVWAYPGTSEGAFIGLAPVSTPPGHRNEARPGRGGTAEPRTRSPEPGTRREKKRPTTRTRTTTRTKGTGARNPEPGARREKKRPTTRTRTTTRTRGRGNSRSRSRVRSRGGEGARNAEHGAGNPETATRRPPRAARIGRIGRIMPRPCGLAATPPAEDRPAPARQPRRSSAVPLVSAHPRRYHSDAAGNARPPGRRDTERF